MDNKGDNNKKNNMAVAALTSSSSASTSMTLVTSEERSADQGMTLEVNMNNKNNEAAAASRATSSTSMTSMTFVQQTAVREEEIESDLTQNPGQEFEEQLSREASSVESEDISEPETEEQVVETISGLLNLNNGVQVVEDGNNLNGSETRPNSLFPVQTERESIARKVRCVLNKVSTMNFHRLRSRWLGLMTGEEFEVDGDEELEKIDEILQVVIRKALDDTIYMHIYAGLTGYAISSKPPQLAAQIRQLINTHIHHKLQKLTTDKELALFDRSTQRVDAARRKKVTLHRFIAELYGEKACTSKFLYSRVTDLLIVNNPSDIDENVECLCVLMTFAGQKLEAAKSEWVEEIFTKLTQRQTEVPQLVSKRIQFMMLDLIEMRQAGWSPHNKWWSPSVPIGPLLESLENLDNLEQLQQDEEGEQSQNIQIRPNPVVVVSSRTNQPEEPPRKMPRQHHYPAANGQGTSNSFRSRTVSEGSPSVLRPDILFQRNVNVNLNGQNQVVRPKSELTPNQSRALMALLNKVSPYNLDRIAHQLYEVLNEETMDDAVTFIVDKILDDSFYTRTHASLINKVSGKPNMKNFGLQIASRVMKILQRNSDSKDGFQFLAELYNLKLISIHQVRTALEWLMNCSAGMISSAVESLVIFLFIAGAKLEAEVRDELWMNRLIEFWEKKANLVGHNQGRPMCLLRDVIELRQNKWRPVRTPHWIPPTIDLPTIRFEPESLIRLFQNDRLEFLRFVKGETSTLTRIEKFSKDALDYAVRHGDFERDPDFLKNTGICLKVLVRERLLKRRRLENFLGSFVSDVIKMKRRNANAWDNLGLVMSEVY